jgi:hypothetical protein
METIKYLYNEETGTNYCELRFKLTTTNYCEVNFKLKTERLITPKDYHKLMSVLINEIKQLETIKQ